MKKLLGLAVTLLLAATVYAGDDATKPAVPNITVPDITISELKDALASGKVTLLDANGTESWQKGHIPGAINFRTSEDKLTSLLPTDKSALIVAYCGNPKCVAYKSAAKAAKDLGYTNIKHLPAGIQGWVKAGEPTEKGS
jgi:rhodanese-related sulfurtransferase